MKVTDSLHKPVVDAPVVSSRQAPTATDAGTAPFHTVLDETRRAAPDSGSSGVHVVRQGEHLSGIVRRQLRAQGIPISQQAITQGVRQLAVSNGISNPDLIHPGQTIRMDGTPTEVKKTMLLPPKDNPMRTAKWTPRHAEALNGTLTLDRSAVIAQHYRANTLTLDKGDSTTLAVNAQQPPAGNELETARRLMQSPPRGGLFASARSRQTADMISAGAPASAWMPRLRSALQTDPVALKSAASSSALTRLVEGTSFVSSDFGMRKDPFTGEDAFHQGLDIAAAQGANIRPCAPGQVAFSGWLPGYGKTVIVRHDPDTETIYAHCSQIQVKHGEQVNRETVLAQVGSTGRSTGNHLHFEVRHRGNAVNPVNPPKNIAVALR